MNIRQLALSSMENDLLVEKIKILKRLAQIDNDLEWVGVEMAKPEGYPDSFTSEQEEETHETA